jgi:hypothetical protein
MGFKMNGFSTHSGTDSHRSALKAHVEGHVPKPKMSKVSKHGQLNDAQADFKSDQEAYHKAMAKKPKGKSMEDLYDEGFDPNEARKMQEDGAETGEAPGKFLKGIFGKEAKAGRAKRKAMRKTAKVKRKAAKKVTKAENRKIKQTDKTAKLKTKLASRQKKAETNVNEAKAEKTANVGTNAEMASKSDKRAVRKYKVNKGIHDFTEGLNAVLYGRSMSEYDGEDPRNKLKASQNQNKTLGTTAGTASKSKTSKKATLKQQIAADKKFIKKSGDATTESMKEKFPDTYGKSNRQKATEKRASDYKKANDPLMKAAKGLMPDYSARFKTRTKK